MKERNVSKAYAHCLTQRNGSTVTALTGGDGDGVEWSGLWVALGRLWTSHEVGKNTVIQASLALTQGNFLPICISLAIVPVAQMPQAAVPTAATGALTAAVGQAMVY